MRRHLGICGVLAGFLAAAPAFAQQPVTGEAGEDPTIVVTSVPIQTLRRELEQCLAEQCGARDDMAKSLAYAEGLFVGGDYSESRSVLAQSIGRNRDAASVEPELLSQLFRASGRISIHLGEADRYRRDTHRIVRTLKAGATRDEAELLMSELEVAEMSLKIGNPMLAERTLDMVIRRARAAELDDIAAIAGLRRALMPYLGFGNKYSTIKRLKTVSRLQGDGTTAAVRTNAKVLLARLTTQPTEAPDPLTLLDKDDPLPARQMMIWSPPFDTERHMSQIGENPTVNAHDRWADIGFRVRPDGRVDDVTVLRRNGGGDWLEKSVAQLEGRLYSPLPEGAADGDGDYRVERHTFTSYFLTSSVNGVRSLRRDGVPRVEIVDLTLSTIDGSR